MSLIEEALRRVQDPVVKSMPWPTTSVPQPLAKTLPAGRSKHTSPFSLSQSLILVAIAVAMLSLGLAIGALFWIRGMRTQSQRVPAPAPILSNSSDGLIVTGVVEGLGQPFAVINGAIVAVGERIREHTLLEIANGIVRLRRPDGEEVLLRVPR